MKTDVIAIYGTEESGKKALREADKMAFYKELSPKNALHLRLLTEEMVGMMRSITGNMEGKFWIEDEDGVYRLHLQVLTRMNTAKREKLLNAATSGKNEAARGLMGRLRDFFDRGADEDVLAPASPLLLPGTETSTTPTLDWEWSMCTYQEQLSELVDQKNETAMEMWDELEKSVVTHVADDIRVSIRGQLAEMTIVKKMA